MRFVRFAAVALLGGFFAGSGVAVPLDFAPVAIAIVLAHALRYAANVRYDGTARRQPRQPGAEPASRS